MQPEQQTTSPLSVSIPKELHVALKIDAAKRGKALKDVVTEVLSRYIDGSTQKREGAAA